MCILTRQVKDEAELLRFVRSPDGLAVPDVNRKLPGRGVWLSLSRVGLLEAMRKKAFSRGFATETAVSPDLPDLVSRLLRDQAVSLLSLARKAGEAVAGFGKVEDMIASGRAGLVLHAREAAPDGCRKLDRLAGPETARIQFFEMRELDLAFGRSNVVHAAVAKGALAGKLSAALRRNEMYEGLAAEAPEDLKRKND
jgi:predicted RNA-binding protein YlxR (DUF448 family)